MRLPIYLWNSFWMKLGRRVIRRPQRFRSTSIESLQPRVMMTATAQARVSPLLAAALADVGPATTYSFAGGQLKVSFDSSGCAVAQPAAIGDTTASQVPSGSLSGTQTLDGSATGSGDPSSDSGSPDQNATTLPASSVLVFQGQNGVDNTLSLDLANLPHLADGSSAITTIVYNGGSGGYNTLDVTGGRFRRESYKATGPDSGILTYNDLKVIFTGLSPVIDTTSAYGYYFYGGNDNDHIHFVDGADEPDQSYLGGYELDHTLRIYDDEADFEEVTLANKTFIGMETLGANDQVYMQFDRQPTGVSEIDLLAGGDNTVVDATAMSGSVTVGLASISNNDTFIVSDQTYVDSLQIQADYGYGSDNRLIVNSSVASIYSITGNDVTNFASGAATAYYSGINNLTVSGGSGDNLFYVSQLNTGTSLNLIGSSGIDSIEVDNQNASIYNLNVNSIGVSNGTTIDYSDIDSVSLFSDAANTINVLSTTVVTPVTIHGSDSDVVNIGVAVSGTLNNIAGAVTVDGGGSHSSLNVNDQATSSTSNYIYTVTGGSINRAAVGAISYLNVGTVVLSTSAGADTVNVNSTTLNSLLTVHGGVNDDTFNLGASAGSVDDLQSPVSIDGGGGNNTLNIKDQSTSDAGLYDVYYNSIGREIYGAPLTQPEFSTTFSNVHNIALNSRQAQIPSS